MAATTVKIWRGMRQPKTVTGVLTVLDAYQFGAEFRRLRFADEPSHPFVSDFQPGEALKLLLPVQLCPTAVPDGAPGLGGRAYTLRNVDPEAGTFELDFVLHGGGRAATWAQAAQPDWTVLATGKRFQFQIPPQTERLVLFGDATAAPAMAEILKSVPDLPALAVLALDEDANPGYLSSTSSSHEVRWVQAKPGALAAALRTIDTSAGVSVWAACEAGELAELRKILRRERQLSRERVSLSGYWRRGMDLAQHQGAVSDAAAEIAKRADIGNQYEFESFDPAVDLVGKSLR